MSRRLSWRNGTDGRAGSEFGTRLEFGAVEIAGEYSQNFSLARALVTAPRLAAKLRNPEGYCRAETPRCVEGTTI